MGPIDDRQHTDYATTREGPARRNNEVSCRLGVTRSAKWLIGLGSIDIGVALLRSFRKSPSSLILVYSISHGHPHLFIRVTLLHGSDYIPQAFLQETYR
jgi:hypothetical protein